MIQFYNYNDSPIIIVAEMNLLVMIVPLHARKVRVDKINPVTYFGQSRHHNRDCEEPEKQVVLLVVERMVVLAIKRVIRVVKLDT